MKGLWKEFLHFSDYVLPLLIACSETDKSDVLLNLFRKASPQRDSEQLRLEETLELFGLRVRENVPSDGNCLFHAVSDQLNRLGGDDFDHVQLRDLAVKTLRDESTRKVRVHTSFDSHYESLFARLVFEQG